MMREKCSYSFLRSLVKGQDHSFFIDLTGVFCTVGGTLDDFGINTENELIYRCVVYYWAFYKSYISLSILALKNYS
jgi:hypothetical protein